MDGYEYAMQKREERADKRRLAAFWDGVASACEARYQAWDECTPFWGCKRRGPYGRHNPGCEPNESCLSLR